MPSALRVQFFGTSAQQIKRRLEEKAPISLAVLSSIAALGVGPRGGRLRRTKLLQPCAWHSYPHRNPPHESSIAPSKPVGRVPPTLTREARTLLGPLPQRPDPRINKQLRAGYPYPIP